MKGQRIEMKEASHRNDLQHIQDMQFIHDGHDSKVNDRCLEVEREY